MDIWCVLIHGPAKAVSIAVASGTRSGALVLNRLRRSVAFRLLKRRLMVALLALSILPGWPELLENVEHLLHDGHLAHSAQHDEASEGEAFHEEHGDTDEHGCTPMAHHCPCHISLQAVLTPTHVPKARVASHDETRGSLDDWDPTSLAIPPPTRPPIA